MKTDPMILLNRLICMMHVISLMICFLKPLWVLAGELKIFLIIMLLLLFFLCLNELQGILMVTVMLREGVVNVF